MKPQTTKQNLIDALEVMLKPLVKLLISNGVTHSDFSDVLKDIYVDSVVRNSEEAGRINQSQIAIKTGLTRKEVKKVIDRALSDGAQHRPQSRPERVLSGWHNDPAFTGPYGLPLELPFESEHGEKSFSQLVKTYGADMSPKATLEELQRGGSVEIAGNGLIRAIRRDFQPAALSPELISRLGDIGYKFFSTAAKNIENNSPEGGGYFDRWVYAENGCTANVIDLFDSYIREHGQQFLEDLDRWFAANEHMNKDNLEKKETGLYMVHYVQGDNETTNLAQLLATKNGSY